MNYNFNIGLATSISLAELIIKLIIEILKLLNLRKGGKAN